MINYTFKLSLFFTGLSTEKAGPFCENTVSKRYGQNPQKTDTKLSSRQWMDRVDLIVISLHVGDQINPKCDNISEEWQHTQLSKLFEMVLDSSCDAVLLKVNFNISIDCYTSGSCS